MNMKIIAVPVAVVVACWNLLTIKNAECLIGQNNKILNRRSSAVVFIGGRRRKQQAVLSLKAECEDTKKDEGSKHEVAKRVVIIGGGWAGFSAAESLSKSSRSNGNLEIILLDASKRGSGGLAGGWSVDSDPSTSSKKKKKRSMEMGIHGFWREYRNTFDVIKNIEAIDSLDDVLTPYLPSVLVSELGKVATAPVLGDKEGVLPPALDIALKADITSSASASLTPFDLLSGLNLLPYYADFIPSNDSNGADDGRSTSLSWQRYDQISAENLCLYKAKITSNLYKQLVQPLLHVLPMATGWDCSAAAALSCFHVFALQSYGAFDVRWCRGSITEYIFAPWEDQLRRRGVVLQNGRLLSNIDRGSEEDGKRYDLTLNDGSNIQADAIIFAVGGPAMNRVIQQSHFLKNEVLPNPEAYTKLRGVTCVSVRVFLKPSAKTHKVVGGATHLPIQWANAMQDSPVFVCGPNVIPQLYETGFCIYDLQRLQDYYTPAEHDGDHSAVLHVDYFRADTIANLKDEDIVQLTLRAISKAFADSEEVSNDNSIVVLDAYVNRARNAVSHFYPGSASLSPSITLNDNEDIYICGDWVDRCDGHSSWSTEKSVVTARQAAQALCKKWDDARILDLDDCDEVIPVLEEVQVMKQIRNIAKFVRGNVINRADEEKMLIPSILPWEAFTSFVNRFTTDSK